jgi:hypothetical protein
MFTTLDNMNGNILTADLWIVAHDILLTEVVNLGSGFHAGGPAPTNDEAQQAPSFLWRCGR